MSEEIEEKEIWKVWRDTRKTHKKYGKGYLWEVSNFGNIRKNGEAYIPRIKKGYFVFGSGWLVHRAVAELFLPSNTEHKPTIDHKNRITTDNRVQNLRYATYKEQVENRDKENLSKKLSKALTGRIISEETKKRLSEINKGSRNPMYGCHHTKEAKNKISEASKGRNKGKKIGPFSEEHKKHLREAWARRKSIA